MMPLAHHIVTTLVLACVGALALWVTACAVGAVFLLYFALQVARTVRRKP